MNKAQKIDYQQQIENYFEEHQVYDIFEHLLKSLLKEKPKDPIDFLISRLENPEPKRIFMMGPPHSRKKEKALTLAEEFGFTTVSVGDLLDREIGKRSDYGKRIAESKSKFSFVDDEIVIDLVSQQIKDLDKNHVIEGFPRTRVQAIALQKMGIVPDMFFVLNMDEGDLFSKIKNSIASGEVDREGGRKSFTAEEVDQLAQNVLLEYNLNIKDVKEAFSGFFCEIDANQDHDTVVNDIARIMKLKVRSNAPRRPPRILLVGPPGSGKTTLSRLIAKKYGLINVSTSELLNAEVASKSKAGRVVAQLIKDGDLVPDEMIIGLVESRINASDCKVNGWILEGFPKSEGQIHMLKEMKIHPSLVVVLEIEDDIVFERHEYKKVDPVTGQVYSMKESLAPSDDELRSRLVARENDKLDIVKKRLKNWKDFCPKVDEAYREKRITLNADKSLEVLIEAISDSIENPTA